jgi:hypothetical protein
MTWLLPVRTVYLSICLSVYRAMSKTRSDGRIFTADVAMYSCHDVTERLSLYVV